MPREKQRRAGIQKAISIMAVPKRRTSKARQGKRRSHQHLKVRQNAYCVRCGEAIRPHFLCWNCGWQNTQAREAVVIGATEES
jgi:large subunit ribosomal protein L32